MKKIEGSLVTVSIGDRNLQKAKAFPYYSGDTIRHFHYLEAFQGDPYRITIRLNDASGRYMIGISIDGQSVVDRTCVNPNVENALTWRGNSYIFNVGEINGGVLMGWGDDCREDSCFRFSAEVNEPTKDFRDTSASGTIVLAVFREEENTPSPSQGCACCGRHFAPEKEASEIFVIKYVTPENFQKLEEMP